jgi:ribose transport system permease protein
VSSEATVEPANGEAPNGGRTTALELVERYGLLLLTGVVVIFFAVLPATSALYLTTANIQTTLANQAILALATIALIPPLVCGRFDLSVGAVIAACAVVFASLMSEHGWALLPAIGVTLLVGGLLGTVNALVVVRAHIDSLIGTLATSTIITGLVALYTGGTSYSAGVSTDLISFGTQTSFEVPRAIFLVLVIAVVTWFLLEQTPTGRRLAAIGSSERAAKLIGIKTDRLVFGSFVLGGILASVAAILLVARNAGTTPTAGLTFLLPAFAAAFLGVSAIRPGRFNVWGALVAILFLSAITSGLNLAGAADYVDELVNGTALLVGVGLTTYLVRRRTGEGSA